MLTAVIYVNDKIVAQVDIQNDGTGTDDSASYDVALAVVEGWHCDPYTVATRLVGWDRKRQAHELVHEALRVLSGVEATAFASPAECRKADCPTCAENAKVAEVNAQLDNATAAMLKTIEAYALDETAVKATAYHLAYKEYKKLLVASKTNAGAK